MDRNLRKFLVKVVADTGYSLQGITACKNQTEALIDAYTAMQETGRTVKFVSVKPVIE